MDELFVKGLIAGVAGGLGGALVALIWRKLPRIRFEWGRAGEPSQPTKAAKTGLAGPVPAQIEPILKAVAASVQIRNQIMAREHGLKTSDAQTVPLREAVMDKAMQERGPVPDVPAIRWTDDAINVWLMRQGFKTQYPVHIFQDPNGNLMYSQPLDPEKFYAKGQS